MRNYLKSLIAVAALAVSGFSASAADLYVPPAPVPPQVVYQNFGGWYLRGDIDYHWSNMRGGNYITYGAPCGVGCVPGNDFDSTDLKGSFSVGAGVGYQINSYLRADVTGDYWFKSDFTGTSSSAGPCGGGGGPCASTDTSSMSALLLLANAYVDLGTWYGLTPYVGAGLGGAYVDWEGIGNAPGESNWRFAWALMAGASYCLTDNLDLDVGYRFSRISGGRMAGYDAVGGVGPFFDDGFDTHEVRAGLRYQFGAGAGRCAEPQFASYEAPVYK
jgi:opacity protein-like surface antigen